MIIEWIAVKEKMPVFREQLLLYISDTQEIVVGSLMWCEEDRWIWELERSGSLPYKNVSHWHPVPSPPSDCITPCPYILEDWRDKLPKDLTIRDVSEMYQIAKKNDEYAHRINSLVESNNGLRHIREHLEGVLQILSENEDLSLRNRGWILSVINGDTLDEL